MAQRGRGKVIPRPNKGVIEAGNDAPATTFAVVAAQSCSSSATYAESSRESLPAAPRIVATTLAVEPAGSKPVQPTDASAACTDVSSSNNPQSSWRCAAYLQGGQPSQLQPQQLGTASSRQLLTANKPVLVRGLQLTICQLATAGVGSSSSAGPGDTHSDKVVVLCSPADMNRFIAADLDKNQPGSYYHLRKPETSQLAMRFTDWATAWQSWQQSRLLLQAEVCQWELLAKDISAVANSGRPVGVKARLWPNSAVWPHLPQLLQASKAAGSSAASLVDWQLLQQLLHDGQYQAQGGLQLLAGGRDALLPAKYETHDRLLCQVSGRQQLLLMPPEQGFPGCYPYPVAHPYDRYSCVDWEEPELQHWPAAAQVKGMECELAPGDSLLIPAYWFVHSQLLQPACVSLAVRLQPSATKLQGPGALLMQLSRMVELWLAAEAGTANVRQWLMALAKSREWQLLEKQLATPKGYKLLQVCHMVLQHAQGVLSLMPQPVQVLVPAAATNSTDAAANSAVGSAATAAACTAESKARQLLACMCEERLMPTHWLNEGIKDPLYLKHPPQHFLIREDAEAAHYPGLFSHRLIQNKPDWQQHAQQLQLQAPRPQTLRLQG